MMVKSRIVTGRTTESKMPYLTNLCFRAAKYARFSLRAASALGASSARDGWSQRREFDLPQALIKLN